MGNAGELIILAGLPGAGKTCTTFKYYRNYIYYPISLFIEFNWSIWKGLIICPNSLEELNSLWKCIIGKQKIYDQIKLSRERININPLTMPDIFDRKLTFCFTMKFFGLSGKLIVEGEYVSEPIVVEELIQCAKINQLIPRIIYLHKNFEDMLKVREEKHKITGQTERDLKWYKKRFKRQTEGLSQVCKNYSVYFAIKESG